MHWWLGTPPIDSRAATAIRRLCNLKTNSGSQNRQRKLVEFETLIRIYNCWLNQMGSLGIRDLQQYDYDTQNQWPDLRCWNSPVRILDKFLWITGVPQPAAP